MARPLLVQSTLLGAGRGAGKVLSFIGFILIARALGPESYGFFAFAMSAASLLSFLPNMGVDPYYSREVARGTECPRGLLKPVLELKLLGGILFLVLYPLVMWFSGGNTTSPWTVAFLTSAFLLLCFTDTWRSVLITAERAGAAGLLDLLQAVIFITLVALAVTQRLSAQSAALAFGVSQAVPAIAGAVLVWRLLSGSRPRASQANVQSLLPSTLPLMVIWLFSDLYLRVDATMLYYLKGETETGYYAASWRLVDGVFSATLVLCVVILPRMSRSWSKSIVGWASEWRQSSIALLSLIAAPVLLFWGWPELIIGQLYGPDFSSSAASLKVLGPATAVICYGCLQGIALTSMGLERHQLVITAVGLFVNVGLNLWMIPRLGAVGAAWSTLFSGIVFAILAQYRLHRAVSARGSGAVPDALIVVPAGDR